MFSSLSNFLPSALHSSPQKTDQLRPDDDDDDDDPANKSDANPDETCLLKKKKDKSANETFIFVRPPPAKSNHPLNLQVQLVPPNSRGPSGLTSASRQSLDIHTSAPTTPATSAPTTPIDSAPATPVTATPEAYDGGVALHRSPSNRSIASSVHSTYSSTSTASGASSTSSRRMIVPLYNLQAHNVMTNTIVDAGTDAKIARFTKRGIEMLDLAVLEPVEVYAGGGAPTGGEGGVHPTSSGFSHRTVGGRPSISGGAGLLMPGNGNGAGSRSSSRPGTPDHDHDGHTNSSQASLASSSAHSNVHIHAQQFDAPSVPAGQPGTPTKRNLFGKLFKKKDAPDAEGTPTPKLGHTRALSTAAASEVATARPVSPAPPRTSMSSANRASIDFGGEEPAAVVPAGARAPVLGVQPAVSAPTHPPKGRPGLYVWVVKRWMKSEGGGLLAVARGMVKGQGGEGDLTGEVEVRFEWKRGKAKKRKDHERGVKEKEKEHPRGGRKHGSTANLVGGAPAPVPLPTPSKRLSVGGISRQSSFSTAAASEDGHGPSRRMSTMSVTHGDEDSGTESDPEDSETPWTCTVKVRRLAALHSRGHSHSHSHHFSREGREEREVREESERAQWKKEVVRIKVGTLSPTPHHPKVVAMLKVPFPLPDVDVEHMAVRKREVGHGSVGAGAGAPKTGPGLMLTAEEIKDVVCSTGLWLVVREGFGGVGKVSRKGDGWRIRG
ncbi:hypothetical protein B0H15DRAFT_834050 [Mycena belliarum]|uniref:Uncharacterized protein n=1 Tax=Mycena belliarum TaxID=1033014 RepID=A0AAD6U6C5_9AGAR|nr:hypothetical protein B0H15DRAFT_834050 [Mycena belliae]